MFSKLLFILWMIKWRMRPMSFVRLDLSGEDHWVEAVRDPSWPPKERSNSAQSQSGPPFASEAPAMAELSFENKTALGR